LDGEISTSLALDANGNKTKESPIYKFNHNTAKTPGQEWEISRDAYLIAKNAQEIYEDTGHVFNPAVYPLVELWGLSADKLYGAHQPLNEVIARVEGELAKTDYSNIELTERGGKYYLRIKGTAPAAAVAGMQLDFGGYAKGYAADMVYGICEKYGLVSGIINISGNVQLYGQKADGTPWTIGVNDPLGAAYQFAYVQPGAVSAVTSGTYERRYWVNAAGLSGTGITDDNVYVNHIIDPRTGSPINLTRDGDIYGNPADAVISVTVFHESSALADAYATTVCVLGLEAGKAFLADRGLRAIVITADRKYYLSADFRKNPAGDAYSNYHSEYTRLPDGGSFI
jgi:thiamine biosynthesis lipoprotein